MKKEIHIRIADCSGNVTIFVLDRHERSEYASVAKELLAREYGEAVPEQVAFVTGPESMEMCGLEFCGNASRAFALMCTETGRYPVRDGVCTVSIGMSGVPEPLEAAVYPEDANTRIRMPHHRCISERYGGTLVEYDGIVHLILTGEEATAERFEELRAAIASELDPPAIGVMFCSIPSDGEIVMTPVVYVRDVGTVYWEGSCGSGSTAAAAACSAGRPDGVFRYTVVQPAGTLIVSTEVVKGETMTTWLEGKIRLYDPETVVIGSRPESAGASAGA